MFQPRTIIEPFKIKSVEPLPLLSRDQRVEALKRARFNLFRLKSLEVIVDMLTDSGTSAMSSDQWAELQRGDEAYAGSQSFDFLMSEVKALTGFETVIPTHQGRASERILFSVLSQRHKAGGVIPNNSHFDTTRANLESLGFEGVDLPCEEFSNPTSDYRFKGNIHLQKLENLLKSAKPGTIPVGFITLTNNSCGGQPASFENIKAAASLYKKFGIPFYIDACRFAENAAFIHKYERSAVSPRQIAQDIFSLCDGFTFSAKKDAFVNIGGLLATRDVDLLEDMKATLILTEGFPTYGGLAGRDLAAMAQGLKEVLDPHYLHYRLAVTEYLGRQLDRLGIPYLKPAGGHAIYLDAKRFCSHLEWSSYPGQALALSLYLEAGIRSCEIGSVMFGRRRDGSESSHTVELVRLAIPRRVYTQSHMDYVLEALEYVFAQRRNIQGVKILKEPKQLRHFNCDFSWPMIEGNDNF